jgi:hypothetical protein
MKVTIELPEGYTIDDIRIPKRPKKHKDNRAYSREFRNLEWAHINNETLRTIPTGGISSAARDLKKH